MDGRTPLNKEEEDECHKTRPIIKALTNRRSFMEAKSRFEA
jgi:hypothetical protein